MNRYIFFKRGRIQHTCPDLTNFRTIPAVAVLILMSLIISREFIYPDVVFAETHCHPGYSRNASTGRCEAEPGCPGGQYDHGSSSPRCINIPVFSCLSGEYGINLIDFRCEKFPPACPCGGNYDLDLGGCKTSGSGSPPSCPCDYTWDWKSQRCLRAPTCPDGGSIYGIGGNLEMCVRGIDTICPDGYFYSWSEKLCYLSPPLCPDGGGLNATDDICVSTFTCVADETCGDGLDNDCDGQTDEGCPNEDLDNDDYYSNDKDCDDNDATVYPGAPEVCDGKDNDCDGNRDDTCSGQDKECVEHPNSTVIGSSANFASGNLFHSQRVSGAERPGLIKLDIAYNSLDPTVGPFGRRWTHSYNSRISDYGDTVVYTEGDGRNVYYYRSGSSTYNPDPASGRHSTIRKNTDNTYTLTKKSGLRYDHDTVGRLTTITDRNSNTVSLTYTGDDLTSITDASGRVTTLYYSANKITSITDPGGRTTLFTYNGDFLSSVTDPAGGAWTFSYDTDCRMLIKTDQLGHTTTYVHDTEGRITSSRDGEGEIKTISYDQTGRVAYVTEKNGAQWTYEYDEVLNVPLRITDPDGNVTVHEYDSDRNLLSVTDTAGNRTSYKYDTNGNRTKEISALGRITSYSYNSYGQITQITDPDSNKTTFTYDTKGNLIRVTDADNKMTQHTYGSLGERLSTRDAKWKLTTFTYDQYGNLASVKNPLNQTITYSYDIMGNLLAKTDANGNTTAYEYDSNDRLIRETKPDGGVIQYEYDLTGNVTAKTDAHGNRTTFAYDNMNRPVKTIHPDGSSINYTYDPEGNMTSMTIKDGSDLVLTSVMYTYDNQNRMVKTTNADATFSEQTYDSLGNVISRKDENGNSTAYTYDVLNRLMTVTDPGGGVTSYTYDARNNLLTVTDANGNATSYSYDRLNRLISALSPDTGTTTYKYDDNGNMTTRTDAGGIKTIYTYDALNRLTTVKFPDTTQNITYDHDNTQYQNSTGRLTSMTDPSGTTWYDYDSLGRIVKETKQTTGVTYITEYTYDLNGNLLTVTYPGGRVITYTHNQINKLIKVEETSGGATRTLAEHITYLPFGDITSMTHGNGIATTGTHNDRYWLSGLTIGMLKQLSYARDNISNITGITDILEPAKNRSYTYDNLYRLTRASGPWGTLAYGYDPVGNRTSETTDSGSTIYIYITNTNKLSSTTGEKALTFSYDNNGNTAAEDARQYLYNQNQRLIQAVEGSNVLGEYIYNGKGQRVKKCIHNGSQCTIFHYNQQGMLIAESTISGDITAEYVYLNGLPLAKIEGDNIFYYHNDHLGTPMLMTDDRQNVVWESDPLPFGEPHSITGTITNNLRFPGQYYDAETGLYYNYFRDYKPEIGRYVEADPIGLLGGINLYAYVGNNPVKFVDPWGLLRYNKPPPFTIPPTGDTLHALQCLEKCVGEDLLVTGGSEDFGHSEGSLHYKNKACDIAGPKFNPISTQRLNACAKQCGFTHGQFEDYSGENKDHWHYQIGPGLGVPEL